jgi:hypothetical protein
VWAFVLLAEFANIEPLLAPPTFSENGEVAAYFLDFFDSVIIGILRSRFEIVVRNGERELVSLGVMGCFIVDIFHCVTSKTNPAFAGAVFTYTV